ncbi:MAG: hypothetical protein ACLUB5_01720 [Bifidobacterium dentium]
MTRPRPKLLKFAEYACHNAEGIKTRVAGGAFLPITTLASDDFLNMTSD